MTTTKTKTSKTLSMLDIIAKAEAEAHAIGTVAREARQAAALAVPEAEQAVGEVELAVANMRASWTAGDASATGQDYALASGKVIRAQDLAEGARGALAKANRSTPNTDKSLAEALVPVLEQALPGVPVVATFVTVSHVPELAETPIAIIVQTVTAENRDGAISGKVGVLFFRSPVMRELSKISVEDAAKRLGVNLTAHVASPHVEGDGVLLDRATVPVAYAVSELPTVAKVRTVNLSRLLGEAASDLALTGTRGGPVKFAPTTRSYASDTLLVEAVSADVDYERVDDDGVRTLGVKLVVGYSEHASKSKRSTNAFDTQLGIGNAGVSDGIERVVNSFNGRFLPGLGRVIGAQSKLARSDHGTHGLTIILTIQSTV